MYTFTIEHKNAKTINHIIGDDFYSAMRKNGYSLTVWHLIATEKNA